MYCAAHPIRIQIELQLGLLIFPQRTRIVWYGFVALLIAEDALDEFGLRLEPHTFKILIRVDGRQVKTSDRPTLLSAILGCHRIIRRIGQK